MPKFEKKILKPGVYQSPDGEINISRERLDHWVKQFKKMSDFGLKIPTPWGHQSGSKPLTYDEKEYQSSKYNAGFIEKLEIGNDGSLMATLDVPLEEDAQRIGTVVKEVSPQIETAWRDGKGRIWNDVVTHLAFVTHPVVPGQSNFEEIKDDPLPRFAMRLSLSDLKGDNEMAEDKDKKEKKDAPVVEKEVSDGDEVAGGFMDGDLVDLLASVHIMIPPDVKNDEEFKVALKAAVMTLKDQLDQLSGDEGVDQDAFNDLNLPPLDELQKEPPVPGGENPEETPEVAKQPLTEEQPMQMSLKDNKEFQNTKSRLSLVEKRLEEQTRLSLKAEVKDLLKTGRITPVISQKLDEKLKVYRLSLNSHGEPEATAVSAEIETLKMLPEGCVWSNDEKVRLRNTAEEALPSDFTNLSEVDAEKVVEQQLRYSGRGFSNV